MMVLLQSAVSNLGYIGDIVQVKPGYARNYLFPKGLAILADTSSRKQLAHNLKLAEHKKAKALTAAREYSESISNISLTITKAVGEEDRIFGSVTTQELSAAFKELGHNFDRKQISILEDIKKVGVYKGSVRLHPEVNVEFKIWVVSKA